MTGAWSQPAAREVVLSFVNVSDEPVTAQVTFDPEPLGLPRSGLLAKKLTSGSKDEEDSDVVAILRHSTFARARPRSGNSASVDGRERSIKMSTIGILSRSLPLVAGPPGPAAPESHDVYVERTGGYYAYRIPAIVKAPDGSLLAFAEARKYNLDDPGFGNQDIDLVLRRSTDGGRTWSPMAVVEDPDELWSAANPATVLDRANGRIWLLYLRCKPHRNSDTARPGTDDSQVLARTSDDCGGHGPGRST